MYGYKCEYYKGTVKEKLIKKEVFKYRSGFIMLEDVPVGVCNKCGFKYYHSTILKRVEDIAEGKTAPERVESIPVAHLE
jgi:YgiT-type zinc finger domain-containing protein